MGTDALKTLHHRIRMATGPDRELDVLIDAELARKWHDLTPENIATLVQGSEPQVGEDGESYVQFSIPRYTAAPGGLGACIDLLNDILPGYHWGISGNRRDTRGACHASVSTPYGYDGPAPWPEGFGNHDNACLALLLAICSAKIMATEAAAKVTQ